MFFQVQEFFYLRPCTILIIIMRFIKLINIIDQRDIIVLMRNTILVCRSVVTLSLKQRYPEMLSHQYVWVTWRASGFIICYIHPPPSPLSTWYTQLWLLGSMLYISQSLTHFKISWKSKEIFGLKKSFAQGVMWKKYSCSYLCSFLKITLDYKIGCSYLHSWQLSNYNSNNKVTYTYLPPLC